MKPVQFRLITDEESSRFESTPHNPPRYTDSFTNEAFSNEWVEVWTALKQRIESLGGVWAQDFVLSEGHGDSRWIYVTFTSTRLWTPDFILLVVDLLQNLPHDYRIACLSELADGDLLKESLVYLLISDSIVWGKAQNARLNWRKKVVWDRCSDQLRRFGFPQKVACEP